MVIPHHGPQPPEIRPRARAPIDFVAPARLGDVLTARCVEVSRTGRTGVYDVEVHNQRDERIAVFRGRSYTAKGRPAVGA